MGNGPRVAGGSQLCKQAALTVASPGRGAQSRGEVSRGKAGPPASSSPARAGQGRAGLLAQGAPQGLQESAGDLGSWRSPAPRPDETHKVNAAASQPSWSPLPFPSQHLHGQPESLGLSWTGPWPLARQWPLPSHPSLLGPPSPLLDRPSLAQRSAWGGSQPVTGARGPRGGPRHDANLSHSAHSPQTHTYAHAHMHTHAHTHTFFWIIQNVLLNLKFTYYQLQRPLNQTPILQVGKPVQGGNELVQSYMTRKSL